MTTPRVVQIAARLGVTAAVRAWLPILAADTANIPAPAAIEMLHKEHNSAVGLYMHAPQPFNRDVFLRADGAGVYYQTPMAAQSRGSWRTAQLTTPTQLAAADPASATYGSGQEYPLGLGRVARAWRYANATRSGWSVRFLFGADAEAAARKAGVPKPTPVPVPGLAPGAGAVPQGGLAGGGGAATVAAIAEAEAGVAVANAVSSEL
jgi:hypothetical protein